MASQILDISLFKVVVAPEFASIKDADINIFAAAALSEISQEVFGATFQRAWANLTAHLIFLSKRDSQITGIVDSVKVGQIEHRYLNHDRMTQDPHYQVSKYGREYLRLRSQVVRSPVFLSRGDYPPPPIL